MTQQTTPQTKSSLEKFDGSWKIQTLSNGMRHTHIPTTNNHFFVGLLIGGGTRYETTAMPGVAHFLEHMMFRGTEKTRDFATLAEKFENLGGDWNAGTSHDQTEFWYSGIKHNFREVLELFHEFLDKPTLEGIEIERKIILREYEGELNEYGNSTDIDWHMGTLLWEGSGLDLPILGTAESIAAISKEHLNLYRDLVYVPKNMILCTVGDISEEEITAEVAQLFSNHREEFSSSPRPPARSAAAYKGPKFKFVENSDNEYSVMISFICEGLWSKKHTHYEVITRLLSDGFSSILFRHLREKLGLVYSVSADHHHFEETGSIDISADLLEENIIEFLNETFALIRDLVCNGPNSTDFTRSIFRSKVDVELSINDPEDIGSNLAWHLLANRKLSLMEDYEQIENLTPAMIQQTSSELFTQENLGLVIMGPKNDRLNEDIIKAAKNFKFSY